MFAGIKKWFSKKKVYQPISGMSEFGQRLCRVFGENPDEVFGITLYMAPDSAVSVEIKKYVDAENGRKLLQELEKVAWL